MLKVIKDTYKGVKICPQLRNVFMNGIQEVGGSTPPGSTI